MGGGGGSSIGTILGAVAGAALIAASGGTAAVLGGAAGAVGGTAASGTALALGGLAGGLAGNQLIDAPMNAQMKAMQDMQSGLEIPSSSSNISDKQTGIGNVAEAGGMTLDEEEEGNAKKKIKKAKLGTTALQIPLASDAAGSTPVAGLGGASGAGLGV